MEERIGNPLIYHFILLLFLKNKLFYKLKLYLYHIPTLTLNINLKILLINEEHLIVGII